MTKKTEKLCTDLKEKTENLKDECWNKIVVLTEEGYLENALLEATAAYTEPPKAGEQQPALETFIQQNLEALQATPEGNSAVLTAVSVLLNQARTKIKVDTLLQLPAVAEALAQKAVIEAYKRQENQGQKTDMRAFLIPQNNSFNKSEEKSKKKNSGSRRNNKKSSSFTS